jgi:hypothetical protein
MNHQSSRVSQSSGGALGGEVFLISPHFGLILQFDIFDHTPQATRRRTQTRRPGAATKTGSRVSVRVSYQYCSTFSIARGAAGCWLIAVLSVRARRIYLEVSSRESKLHRGRRQVLTAPVVHEREAQSSPVQSSPVQSSQVQHCHWPR